MAAVNIQVPRNNSTVIDRNAKAGLRANLYIAPLIDVLERENLTNFVDIATKTLYPAVLKEVTNIANGILTGIANEARKADPSFRAEDLVVREIYLYYNENCDHFSLYITFKNDINNIIKRTLICYEVGKEMFDIGYYIFDIITYQPHIAQYPYETDVIRYGKIICIDTQTCLNNLEILANLRNTPRISNANITNEINAEENAIAEQKAKRAAQKKNLDHTKKTSSKTAAKKTLNDFKQQETNAVNNVNEDENANINAENIPTEKSEEGGDK